MCIVCALLRVLKAELLQDYKLYASAWQSQGVFQEFPTYLLCTLGLSAWSKPSTNWSGFTTQAQSSGQQRLASIPPHHEHQLKEPTHNLHLLSYLRPMVSDGGLPPSINCGRMGKKGLIRVSQKQHTARWPTSLGWHPPPPVAP